jgi:Fe-S oxidoreductase
MILKTIIFALILITAGFILAKNLKKLFAYLKLAQPENRTDHIGKRLLNTLNVAFFQRRIFRDKSAGTIHASIFWGFLILLFSASEAILQGFFPSFSWSFLGPIYTLITFLTDIFCVLIIFAVLGALYRRFITKVKRLQGDGHEVKDAIIVLSSIFIIVSSLLLQNSSICATGSQHEWAFYPVSYPLSFLFSVSSAPMIYNIFWWVHIIAILSFANYLPFSKHFHVFTSIINVFFSPFTPVNKLPKIDFEKEGVEKFGIVDVEDFTWKTMFDGYTCTHCGRCTEACPANATGKILSPREVIVQVRNRTVDRCPVLQKQQITNGNGEASEVVLTTDEQAIMDKKFIGEYENMEALWQCTTCGACMRECPVEIEHVPAIVGMRRSLVMMESDFPSLLQSAFANLENNASPWAFSPAERADWAHGLDVKIAAENPDFDVLFWVGCSGSFDDRAKKISVAFSRLMQMAGINFAILGSEEQCNGDVARRTGNEYLADMLVKGNIETLNRYNVKKIVTICPHCLNTLKNEYLDFGGNYEVIHHTQFLSDLLKHGKLNLKKDAEQTLNITYHDSCYLGRYNEIYDEPRNILKALPGVNLIETERSGDRGFCCGAGGGQMFMEETAGKRVNIERTEELLRTAPDKIALNCPFCMTMLTDGIKAKELGDSVKVQDIAEILLENVE